MTGEHDYDITVQPFVCRRCERTLDEARATAEPRLCAVIVHTQLWMSADGKLHETPEAREAHEQGTYRPRHAADDYQGIAERMRELGGMKWITE